MIGIGRRKKTGSYPDFCPGDLLGSKLQMRGAPPPPPAQDLYRSQRILLRELRGDVGPGPQPASTTKTKIQNRRPRPRLQTAPPRHYQWQADVNKPRRSAYVLNRRAVGMSVDDLIARAGGRVPQQQRRRRSYNRYDDGDDIDIDADDEVEGRISQPASTKKTKIQNRRPRLQKIEADAPMPLSLSTTEWEDSSPRRRRSPSPRKIGLEGQASFQHLLSKVGTSKMPALYTARALASFSDALVEEEELNFRAGEIVHVILERDDGWIVIRRTTTGEEGYAPVTFFASVENPSVKDRMRVGSNVPPSTPGPPPSPHGHGRGSARQRQLRLLRRLSTRSSLRSTDTAETARADAETSTTPFPSVPETPVGGGGGNDPSTPRRELRMLSSLSFSGSDMDLDSPILLSNLEPLEAKPVTTELRETLDPVRFEHDEPLSLVQYRRPISTDSQGMAPSRRLSALNRAKNWLPSAELREKLKQFNAIAVAIMDADDAYSSPQEDESQSRAHQRQRQRRQRLRAMYTDLRSIAAARGLI